MKRLASVNVQYINRTYQRSGTLWEGRFRTCVAQQEEDLLVCPRYIEMNPVRAGLVEYPGRSETSDLLNYHPKNGGQVLQSSIDIFYFCLTARLTVA